ncbi:hypothetical protein ACFXTH_036288 [Malus domestica]
MTNDEVDKRIANPKVVYMQSSKSGSIVPQICNLLRVKCLIHVVKAGAFKSRSNARAFLLVRTKIKNYLLPLICKYNQNSHPK